MLSGEPVKGPYGPNVQQSGPIRGSCPFGDMRNLQLSVEQNVYKRSGRSSLL